MKEIIFVIDPMCSWSWGFSPTMKKLTETENKEYRFSLVLGGLRTKGDMKWNRESKDYLQNNWEKVHKLTGQPFSAKTLIRETFDYDTYPSCKAVVTVRELWGNSEAFNYLEKIQRAFYKEGIDITKPYILIQYIEKERQKEFIEFYESERAELLMHHDFSKARSMGANSFPSIVKIDQEGHMVCLKGYQPIEEILK